MQQQKLISQILRFPQNPTTNVADMSRFLSSAVKNKWLFSPRHSEISPAVPLFSLFQHVAQPTLVSIGNIFDSGQRHHCQSSRAVLTSHCVAKHNSATAGVVLGCGGLLLWHVLLLKEPFLIHACLKLSCYIGSKALNLSFCAVWGCNHFTYHCLWLFNC